MPVQPRKAFVNLCDAPRSAEPICSDKIYDRFHDATLTLRTIPTFRTFWQDYMKETNYINPGTHYEAGVAPVTTSGFFIERGYFVSGIPFVAVLFLSALFITYIAAMCWRPGMTNAELLASASACCECPGVESGPFVNKYHNIPGFIEVMRGICSGKSFADFFEFDAEVYNVNGCGENLIYRANLVGLDFQTGIGIYRIEPCDVWNKYLPKILTQKYLMFQSSKCYTPGHQVHIIANTRCGGALTYSHGVVSDNANMSRSGDVTYEMMVTDATIDLGAEGAPILNSCGYVVGIVTGMTPCCHAVGVTSSFITRVINAIVERACLVDGDNGCDDNCTPHATYVDLFGAIVYEYGTIDWEFRAKTAIDLNQLFLQAATDSLPCKPCKPCNESKAGFAHPFGIAGCDPCCDFNLDDREYNENNANINRALQGIIISCRPCQQLAEVVEECHSSSPNFGRGGCNEIFQIERGDLVTRLNKAPLGSLPHQNTPLNILYSLRPCTCVELEFWKANEQYRRCHYLNVRLNSSLCWVDDFRPIISKCLNFQDVIEKADISSISCFLQSWVHFMLWILNAVPQIYRACVFTHLQAHLNVLTSFVTYAALLDEDNYATQTAETKKLAVALGLSNISRSVVSILAKPSLETCFCPASFLDFISSFAHPSTYECFKESIPDYTAMFNDASHAAKAVKASQGPAALASAAGAIGALSAVLDATQLESAALKVADAGVWGGGNTPNDPTFAAVVAQLQAALQALA